ncbi:MAG: Nicotinate-nucleotide adenylyltransferase, partial [uncultured Ramlibacter sp.]
ELAVAPGGVRRFVRSTAPGARRAGARRGRPAPARRAARVPHGTGLAQGPCPDRGAAPSGHGEAGLRRCAACRRRRPRAAPERSHLHRRHLARTACRASGRRAAAGDRRRPGRGAAQLARIGRAGPAGEDCRGRAGPPGSGRAAVRRVPPAGRALGGGRASLDAGQRDAGAIAGCRGPGHRSTGSRWRRTLYCPTPPLRPDL